VHGGLPALPGPDDATGFGLVDAYGAAVSAYVASLSGTFSGTSPQSWYWRSLAGYYESLAEMVSSSSPDAADYWRNVAHGYASLGALY